MGLCASAGGMCGFLLPAEGNPCPTVVPTPFQTLGGDISSNATCSAYYANPPHQKHVARPLEGQGFEVIASFEHLRRVDLASLRHLSSHIGHMELHNGD